jgi:hypothetical protein
MAAKRTAPKTSAVSSPPFINALLVALAAGYGLWLLVTRGRVSWPPTELLSSIYMFAGCLALVGPIVLLRRDGEEGGLGDLVWMTGGLLIWVFDLAGLVRGEARTMAWATPLGALPMGLTILAVLLAGWKAQGAARGGSWSWTNVTGWVLGIFWVGMAIAAMIPGRTLGLASR